jgi:hypothetical protein
MIFYFLFFSVFIKDDSIINKDILILFDLNIELLFEIIHMLLNEVALLLILLFSFLSRPLISLELSEAKHYIFEKLYSQHLYE